MSGKKRIGLLELYAKNPLEADRLLWGREADSLSRRGFLRKAGLVAMSAALGADMVFANAFPAGMIPAGLLELDREWSIPGKHPDLIIVNDRPLNAETPAHLLDDLITPGNVLFVRNNGLPPEPASDPDTWTLRIEGEAVPKPKTFTLAELKKSFRHHTYQLTLECAGNGRKEYHPPTEGLQWGTGAVGCPQWTGVRLRDVLQAVGIGSNAVYVGYYGKDLHLSGDPNMTSISRGVPMRKAMEDETLLAWAMNGEPIPMLNGFPLRLVVGGWPASTSGKWLDRIVVRDRIHDGAKMESPSYRVPCEPVAPGTQVPNEAMCIIEGMPVKSLITYPKTGAMVPLKRELAIRGHAWAGDFAIAQVEVSIDFGQTWQSCQLDPPANRLAWQRFQARLRFPMKGYYEVWARATDTERRSQPMILPGWNPKGYLNNACHRIAVKVM